MEREYYDLELEKLKDKLLNVKTIINNETLYKVYKKTFFIDAINDINYDYCSLDVTKKIVLDFFKTISIEYYEKAKAVLDNKNETRLFKRELIGNTERDEDGFLLYDYASVNFNHINNKKRVYLPYNELTSDIYLFVHEIAHTFDLTDFYSPERSVLAEVTPFIFEGLLDKYLLSKNLGDIVFSHKNQRILNTKSISKSFIIISFLMSVIYREKDLNYENLKKNMFTEHELFDNIDEGNVDLFMKKVIDFSTNDKIEDIKYSSKYLISMITASHFLKDYKQENFEEYINTLGYIDLNHSLSFLDLHFDNKGVCLNESEVIESFERNIVTSSPNKTLTKQK